jgi:hypothetical protein
MKTVIYEPLEQSNASWYCCNCGLPNFNTSLFEDFEIHTYSLSSHGYFIGPGFGWQSDAFDVSRAKIYNRCDVEPFFGEVI